MLSRSVLLVFCATVFSTAAFSQSVPTLKAAVVALTADSELRMSFERGLVEKARAHDYDAVTSYDITPNVADVDNRAFVRALAARGIQAVLMLRPAAIGKGSSLEAVRNEVTPKLFENMQTFANLVSAAGRSDDLIAVVHMAIYTINAKDATMISSGAVWLDEDVENRAQGIERLQDLIVANVDGARPAIRQHLGLPPLP